MTFSEALAETLLNREFVREYDRLTGSSLAQCMQAQRQGGFNHQIDVATGRWEEELAKFTVFFTDIVWLRLPPAS